MDHKPQYRMSVTITVAPMDIPEGEQKAVDTFEGDYETIFADANGFGLLARQATGCVIHARDWLARMHPAKGEKDNGTI
jgi:hypothetical protein